MRSLLIVAALLGLPAPARASVDPVVYAHRGGAALAPENTLGAFRQAHEMFGARGVWLEMDTQLSADGVLMVIHDDSVDRTTNCTGKVIALTAAFLQACDAGEAFPGWGRFEPIPTLADVLIEGKAAGWRLMVEIKDIPGEANFDAPGTAVADALMALMEQVSFPKDRLLVQSFWPPALDRIELMSDGIATALLTTSQLPGAPPGAGFYATENAVFSKAHTYEVCAPDYESPDLSADTVDAIHALGMPVVLWTLNDRGAIDDARAWGVDGIISDRPDLVYAILGG